MTKDKLNPTWANLPLWKHQRQGAEMLETYFNSKPQSSALVRMPTGTGETRIIAITTKCFGMVKPR